MRLRLLTEADLSRVAHWFDDAAIQEWLGGRDWLPRELRLVRQRPGTLFRRQLVLRSYAWLALADGRPVGYAGGDIYDRWTQTFDGYPHRSMGISYLVDPAEQGRGIGRALVRAVVTRADLVDVHTFWAGIEADNVASRKCAEAAGFVQHNAEPDFEGTVYYRFPA